ncbi:cohesin domain-containing protein [Desulfonema magnum]|uniref:Cohesin domain-containing protein n=1 Tax=Desulfonema magnum TaxID=45655 RepID=A0A975BRB0_9BACT|nr:cohesin domain-containing protein [Desulfonema magnum]QTA89635.1 Cohesin domain-containing protein [Desulfonema magnum]
MNCISVKWTNAIISVVVALFVTSVAWGTELSIPALEARPGESVSIPIMLDLVDNLAGIKLVMKYDTEILIFKKAFKTKQTSSLMHIVNSKKPGTVIAVMAGARGIKGKNFPILLFKFEIKKDLKSSLSTKMEIREIEMMTDQLKDIKCSIKVNPLAISAKKTEKPEQPVEKPKESAEKSMQNVKKPAQDVEKSAPDAIKKPDQDVEKPAQDAIKKPDQDIEKPAPDAIKKPDQDIEKSASDAIKKPGQDIEKSASDAIKKSGQDIEKPAPDAIKKPGQDIEKSASDAIKKSGQDIEKSDQDVKKSDQVIEKSDKNSSN